MNPNDYQKRTRTTAYYHGANMGSDQAKRFLVGGMMDEAQEVHSRFYNYENKELFGELADMLWYVTRLADENGWTLETLMTYSLNKCKMRHAEHTETRK